MKKHEAGGDHACIRISDGTVKCWGPNGYGQVGDGTGVERLSPTNVLGGLSGVATLSSGWEHNCALSTSGGMKCWGYTDYGESGDAGGRKTPANLRIATQRARAGTRRINQDFVEAVWRKR